MVETVASAKLPVGEKFFIQKQSIRYGDGKKRVCVVSGIHGDELEGQFVSFALVNKIKNEIEKFSGTLEIYPAINPLGINAMSRGVPQFDLDMNRIFPGNEKGTFAEYMAYKVVEDLKGADVVIDIHASNIFLQEIPQVRVNVQSSEILLPLAKMLNTDFIWIHASSTVLESTLAYSLNSRGTKTLVVEMGVGMRITESYGEQLVCGILNLLKNLGMWTGETKEARAAVIGTDENVSFINSSTCGIFLPSISHWSKIKKGCEVGKIINPLTGDVQEILCAAQSGTIFTLREYPVVYSGSLIARILMEA